MTLPAREAPGAGAHFLLLGMAGFGSVICTRICDAMLPALAREFSTSTAEAAATVSAYAVAYAVMQLVYGPLGDRHGKLRVIGIAAVFCALSSASAALSPSLPALVLSRAAMGAATAAVVPLVIAWIGDTVPLEHRQLWLARYSGYTVTGMVVSPVLGGLCAQFASWRVAFVPLALLFTVLAARLLMAPSARAASGATTRATPAASYLVQLLSLLQSARARYAFVAVCVETGLGIAPLAFVPTILYGRFGLDLLHGGAVAGLFGVGGFVFSRTAPRLLRRVGRAAMPFIGGVVLALAFALLAAMPHWAWALPACALAGFGFFAIHNTLQLQATQLSTSASGLALSVFASCIFIGQSVGVALGALTFTRLDPAWSFAVAGLGLFALGWVVRRAVIAGDSVVNAEGDGGPLAT
jgi:predicted MFS family arabinose efflux permease